MGRAIDYDDWLTKKLKDPMEAAAYLNEHLHDGDMELFLQALGNVAKAHGISDLAKSSGLNRESLYKALSIDGNPKLRTLCKILETFGLIIQFDIKRT